MRSRNILVLKIQMFIPFFVKTHQFILHFSKINLDIVLPSTLRFSMWLLSLAFKIYSRTSHFRKHATSPAHLSRLMVNTGYQQHEVINVNYEAPQYAVYSSHSSLLKTLSLAPVLECPQVDLTVLLFIILYRDLISVRHI